MMGTGNGGINEIIPFYKQKTFWTAIGAFAAALGAYLEGSLGLTGLITAGFGALSLIFIRQGVEKSTYIPEVKEVKSVEYSSDIKDRGSEIENEDKS